MCRHTGLVLVLGACDVHTDIGKESDDTEGQSSTSGDDESMSGADASPVPAEPMNEEDDPEEQAGDCIGEPLGCEQFAGEQSCLQQDGCYPALRCVGVEEDCSAYEYLSDECEAAPHCYSDILPGQFSSLPGCWQYDLDCASALPDLEPCGSFGGTCHETTVCEGAPIECEYLSTKSKCEGHMGCYWKPF